MCMSSSLLGPVMCSPGSVGFILSALGFVRRSACDGGRKRGCPGVGFDGK